MRRLKLFLKGFFDGFRITGVFVSTIINFLLLCVVYLVGIGAAAIITKISGISLMTLGKKQKSSYYLNKKIGRGKIDDYYNQF